MPRSHAIAFIVPHHGIDFSPRGSKIAASSFRYMTLKMGIAAIESCDMMAPSHAIPIYLKATFISRSPSPQAF